MDCPRPLVIHRDGQVSCARPGCVDVRSLSDVEGALARHRTWIPCELAGTGRCPQCSRPAHDEVTSRP